MSDEIKITAWWEIVLLIATYAIPTASFFYAYCVHQGHWFARSGSVMVMLAVVLEWRNINLQQALREKRDETYKPQEQYVSGLSYRKVYEILILAALAAGTIIWGYGDLAISNA